MKVVVFGGAGGTGRHVVDAALADGHEVVALARDPARLHRADPRLVGVRGDLRDRGAVLALLGDADAVISAAGHVRGTPPDLLTRLADALVEGLGDRGARVVSLVGAAVDWPGDPPPTLGRRFMIGAMRLLGGSMLPDALAHAARLRESALPFVIARPPRLTHGPASRVVAAPYLAMGPSAALSRANLGRFLVDQLTDDRFLRAAPMLHDAAS